MCDSVVAAQTGGGDAKVDGLAAWSLVHGFATLWRTGALPPVLGKDPAAAARKVARRLFPEGAQVKPNAR